MPEYWVRAIFAKDFQDERMSIIGADTNVECNPCEVVQHADSVNNAVYVLSLLQVFISSLIHTFNFNKSNHN